MLLMNMIFCGRSERRD